MKTRIMLVGISIAIFSLIIGLMVIYQTQKAPFTSDEIQWCAKFVDSEEYFEWQKIGDLDYEPRFTDENFKLKLQKMHEIEPFCKKAIEYGSVLMK